MATQALRVLAMAYKVIDTLPETVDTDSIEHDLIFAGLVGMIDPERKEAAAAIKVAQSAGIRTIMITGDHRDTAQAIAKRFRDSSSRSRRWSINRWRIKRYF